MNTADKDELPTNLGNDIARRERAVIDHEAAVLGRENLATARESVVQVREGVADLREDAAHQREAAAQIREGVISSRERGIRAVETDRTTSGDDMLMLREANSNLVIATLEAHRLTEQVESAKVELDYLAHHDALTNLPNRMLVLDRLGQAIEVARRQRKQLAVMFMDLDRFKHINDLLGHAVGDQLLQSVAKRLVASGRQSDTVSRLGGDEFLLLLPSIERADDAALSAQKMLAALDPPHHIDGNDVHVRVSIGISMYPDDGQDAQTLIKCADTAMYYAKKNGRNSFKFFEPNMNTLAVQRQSIESSLRQALDQQEFVLHYQPKIDLQSSTIVGAEALIRWQHPQRGLLLPIEFVPIAENSGLIRPIGHWVLREACRQAKTWLQAGLPPITVAVNTSVLELHAVDFLENLRAILEETQLEPCYLELELTESVFMRNAEPTGSLLQAIADLGVKLAIDDFGTGYSNLSCLSRFPIDTLKIDQSFVNRMTGNPDDANIVRAVIGMGKSLRQKVIAEGVETPEQHGSLMALHCDEGQGYYFGRPLPAEAFATLLQTGLSLGKSA